MFNSSDDSFICLLACFSVRGSELALAYVCSLSDTTYKCVLSLYTWPITFLLVCCAEFFVGEVQPCCPLSSWCHIEEVTAKVDVMELFSSFLQEALMSTLTFKGLTSCERIFKKYVLKGLLHFFACSSKDFLVS